MSVVEWMRAAFMSRWWALSDAHLRVAMTLVAMADPIDGGALRVESPSDHIAARCSTTRASVRRAIDALAAAGFCDVSARPGRGGALVITIRGVGQFNHEDKQYVESINRDSAASFDRPINPAETGQLQPAEMVCESSAFLRDRGHFTSEKPAIFGTEITDPRARDQDLQRSDLPDPDLRSEIRSPTSRDLTSNTVTASESSASERAKPRTRRIDPAKIPERAWAAADYLRSRVLIENPAAMVGTRPWEYGHRWTAGAGEHIGDGSRTGLRLSWADKFRLFHAALVKALRNADPKATDEVAWEQIARTVHWLFHKQPAEPRFIVECPDSLRDKWDNIQKNIANQRRAAEQPRGANGRPDPIQPRQWVPADQWGKK